MGLQFYLTELDFACSSVGLALNFVKSVGSSGRISHGATSSSGPSPSSPSSRVTVSPSALLKASRRIQELWGTPGGDLCVALGIVFRRALSTLSTQDTSANKWDSAYPARLKCCVRGGSFSLRLEPVEIAADSSTGEGGVVPTSGEQDPSVAISGVNSAADGSGSLIPPELQSQSHNSSSSTTGSQGGIDLPMRIAFDFELTTTQALGSSFGTILEHNPRKLHHGAAITFTYENPSTSGGGSNSASAAVDHGFEVLEKDNNISQQQQLTPSCEFIFLPNVSGSRVADVATSPVPLEVLYVCRLSAMEDQSTSASRGNEPTHLSLSDEAMELLLRTGRTAAQF